MAIVQRGPRHCRKCGVMFSGWRCMACVRENSKAYRAKNKQKAASAVASWISRNSERVREIKRAYYERNKEAVIERARASRLSKSQEERRQWWSRYYEDNREDFIARSENRRSRIRANGGVLNKGIVKRLMVLQRERCACCSASLESGKFHLDHHMPLALGGKNEDANMQLLCASCNLSKGAKHPVAFMQARGFLL